MLKCVHNLLCDMANFRVLLHFFQQEDDTFSASDPNIVRKTVPKPSPIKVSPNTKSPRERRTPPAQSVISPRISSRQTSESEQIPPPEPKFGFLSFDPQRSGEDYENTSRERRSDSGDVVFVNRGKGGFRRGNVG